MKSIKEYNTTGMSLWEREDLYKKVLPIPIGEKVFQSGGAFDTTEVITVTEDNQKIITMFWNSQYFDNLDKAESETLKAHVAYSRYQAAVADSWYWN